MIFETSIKYLITRGTTQIVPLLRNTTSDSSKSYSLTQNHGNAYFDVRHSGSEGIHQNAYHRLTPTVGSLETLANLCVSSSQLMFWIISHYNSFVNTFFENFLFILLIGQLNIVNPLFEICCPFPCRLRGEGTKLPLGNL